MANGIRTGDPRGFNKGRSSKFCEGSRVRQTPEEGWRTYQPKHCGNKNKDEDNSPKTFNDKNNNTVFRKQERINPDWMGKKCIAVKEYWGKLFENVNMFLMTREGPSKVIRYIDIHIWIYEEKNRVSQSVYIDAWSFLYNILFITSYQPIEHVQLGIHIYRPLRSGKIWHKINF